MTHYPDISAVICTRNRGASVVATLETVLANAHPNFEVVLVDQSASQDTAGAVERFCADARFHYVGTPTRGLGLARNVGLDNARAPVVAFTDDDCTVPAHWLASMAAVFDQHPRVAVTFCNVAPAWHDPAAGYIPSYMRHGSLLVRRMWQKCRARGIGAGLAVRRDAVLAMGGFDASLGAGGTFYSCEDWDIAVRALLNGWWVFETDAVAVVHDGFRNWREFNELTRRDWLGIGAAYAKPLKCGHWGVAVVIAYEVLATTLWRPFSNVFRLKRPRGFKRFFFFWQGFARGLGEPVDPQRILFKPRDKTITNSGA